ncbi:MAG: monovalent cation:H+ antiporter-2 CPA2 family, partial [Halothiobacillaceae bacterium]
GMLLGETEFKHQIEADIRPLRDVLLGLFFVTVGMLLDIQVMLSLLPWIVLLAVAIVLFKTLSIMGVGMVMGAPKGVALRTGIVLAQGGEFGLALLALALSEGVLASSPSQITLAAIIVTMALAPLLINYNGHLAKWLFAGSYGRNREQIVEEVTESAAGLREHVIICGYGRIGQNIARFLDQEGFQYCAMDLDPVIVKEARAAGDRVSYGDSTHNDILEAAGLKQAKVLVVSYNEVHSALKIIEQARRIRPDIPILVRTADDANLDRLQQMGATEVVPETLEASLMLASHVLLLMDVPMARIIRRVQGVRRNRYQMLRGFFHGQESESLEQADGAAVAAHSRYPICGLTLPIR